MEIDTFKSSIEHGQLGKLYKYVATIDNPEMVTEAFESLTFGTEGFVPESPVAKSEDAAMMHHSKYSSITREPGSFNTFCGDREYHKYLAQVAGLCIFRGSQENSIRLFISDTNDLANPIFQNRFCYLLGSLNDRKLDIYTGNSAYGSSALCNIGCLFDALETCTGDVTMHVCGRCGMCESLMWLHAKNKCITQYGSLYFSGVGRILEAYPMWREYYEKCFIKAKNFGLITDQDVVDMMTTNNLIYISASDTLSVLQKR